MQNRPKKTKKKIPYYKKSFFIYAALAGIVFCYFLGLLVKLYLVENQKRYFETPTAEQKIIPQDIKKQMENASAAASFRVPILMYHYVEYVQDKKDTIRQSLNINPYIFEEQVKTLKDAGYTFMTAKELGEVLDGKMQMPQNPILLTFDDGHWDFDTDVLPILKKYNVKATEYIISGFIGGSDFMTKDQLQEVVDSGLVDVGAHTVHHVSLKGLSLDKDTYEVSQSKQWLEDTYHIQVVSFAYPNGSFDVQAAGVVRDNGYTTSVSTVPGIEQSVINRFFLYRLRPGGRTGEALLDWLKQNSFRPFSKANLSKDTS